MDTITLFARTPPLLRVRKPLEISVPERYRAELYKAELEYTRLVLEAYAERHPQVAPALLDKALIETLAVFLDNYVGPAVVADVNSFASLTFPGKDISQDTYRQYVVACLERAADPYCISADWQVAALSLPSGSLAGLDAFYLRYPMVRFMVDQITDNYQRNLQRCCDRVLEDWRDLQTFFFGGNVMSELTEIKTTGSDFHKGGGQVMILEFRDALAAKHNLVYKPTDVERDFRVIGNTRALQSALEAHPPNNLCVVTNKGVSAPNLLNNAGSLGEMLTNQTAGGHNYKVPVYRILPVWPGSSLAYVNGEYPIRKSYGYLEYLSSTDVDNRFTQEGDRIAYYRSFGAQLALCWVFQVTDLHQENLIVHERMPYLIDLEMAHTGIMKLPNSTNLDMAYKIFKVGVKRRDVRDFGTQYLRYGLEGVEEKTHNALYDGDGKLRQPDDIARFTLMTAFENALVVIRENVAAYEAWLDAAQNMVTRILPYGTDELLSFLRDLNDPSLVEFSVTLPAEISLKTRERGEKDIKVWGSTFFMAAVPPNNAVALETEINLRYNELAPLFSLWFDPQTATDFSNGDVPSYYQKTNTPHVLNSCGVPIQVDYGLAVQKTTAEYQQPVANALVTLWGTLAPLLPYSYLPGNVVQAQRRYLKELSENGNFFKKRMDAALDALCKW